MAINTIRFPQESCEVVIKDHYRMHRPWMAEDWPKYDRVILTEKQAVDLVEKVSDTAYFSSSVLLNPSIPEFTAIVRDEGKPENTYVMFQRSLMDPEDFEVTGELKDKVSIKPLIDAFVYANNSGTLCNCVITLCRAVLTVGEKKLPTSMHLVTYTHDDPMTEYMVGHPEMMERFCQTVKGIFMGVQMLSLERPEIMSAQTVREEYQETVKKQGRYKPVRKTRFVKVIRIPKEVELGKESSHHSMTCPCWGVAGHWRTYKNGNQVWIKPYRKGKERNNPAAYRPKEYEIPKEE